MSDSDPQNPPRPWQSLEPGRLVGRGHPAGDFLEAHEWKILEQRRGFLKLDAHLPEHTKNPRGQLFGGFTPTYVDFVALFTTRAGEERTLPFTSWLATTNLRVDYFEPVLGPRFVIESELVKERGRTLFVETRFLDAQGELLVFALTTMRRVALSRSLGDA
jgi:acyl-coenzyme A thioesterase PaaI-like protein